MKILWIDLNSSYAHSSLALPALHAQIADDTSIEWASVSATINENIGTIVEEAYRHKPDILAATAWLFNHEQLLHITSRLKALLPETCLILGGPEFLGDNEFFLRKNPICSPRFRYAAVRGFDAEEKHTTKPLMGHFKKAGVTPKRHLAEFKDFSEELNLGDTITVELFNDASYVDVIGTSKGKGFQGVVKRHGFGGVGQTTHGQHNRARKPGSIGACSYPAKVFKGMRMGGQMGGDRVTTHNLQVLKVIPEHNLLLIKGSVPGCKGSIVIIEK